jgi:hypothetical protein
MNNTNFSAIILMLVFHMKQNAAKVPCSNTVAPFENQRLQTDLGQSKIWFGQFAIVDSKIRHGLE